MALSHLRSRTQNYKNAKRLPIALSFGKKTHFKRNYWLLNSIGLNCMGPPICGFLKNKYLPCFPSAVGNLQMRRADFVRWSTPWVLLSVLRSFWNQSLMDPVKGFKLVGSQIVCGYLTAQGWAPLTSPYHAVQWPTVPSFERPPERNSQTHTNATSRRRCAVGII